MKNIEKILTVDDNNINQLVIKKVLSNENREIIVAMSGKAAIDILSKEKDISLILMDIQMPELNGFETVELIKKNEELKDIPIIFITGNMFDEGFITKGFDLGAVDYILKPFEPKVLSYKASVLIDFYNQQKDLKKEYRKLKLITELNNSLLYSEDENTLYYMCCDLLVKVGGYSLAWIGLTDSDDSYQLKVYSSDDNQIGNKFKSLNNISSGESKIINSLVKNKEYTYIYETEYPDLQFSPEKYELKTMIIFPLNMNNSFIGSLFIYCKEKNLLSDDEIQLIHEIVRSFIFGLEAIDFKNIQKKLVNDSFIEKEELQLILSSIVDCVITINSSGKILYANNSACNLFSMTNEDMIGSLIFDLFQVLDQNDKLVLFNPVDYIQNNSNENLHQELAISTKQGNKIIIKASFSELKNSKSEYQGIVFVFNDISNIKVIESQMKLSQTMEALGQLAAGIAHEINTPMQFIGDNYYFIKDGFNSFIEYLKEVDTIFADYTDISVSDLKQIMKDKYDNLDLEYLNGEIPKAIESTQNGVERVRKIVLAMKNFAHPSGKLKSLNNINHGINDTIIISKNEWKYVADLEVKLSPDLQLVNCCLDEINQVMLNLVMNAAQAIAEVVKNNDEKKGKITIETRNAEDFIEIIISDTGCGIPKDKLSRIYDPFFTTKIVGKGTGQGLAITHNIIVNNHNGKIFVESVVGIGTSFKLFLPVSIG
jgi:PAS domain S-box-containing protein